MSKLQVLAELAQDKSMDAFRGEYEKLFNALEKSHKNEKRLNTKCQELGSEIASKQARVDAALDKTGEDQDTIGSLRKEIEKAWKMVDMTQVLPLTHQWLRQISMKLPFAVWRKSALKFTKGRKRENSISYYFLLFWFNQNSISVLKTLLSCLSEKTL